MDINDKVSMYGDILFATIKEDLKRDLDIKLDDDAEADWNEFWDSFVLSRLPDDEWDNWE